MMDIKNTEPYLSEISISLIVATINRRDELDSLFNSFLGQDFDLKKIEIIVVDQNNDGLIDAIVEKYSGRFEIIHIKSRKKGLSLNRNLGLNLARGWIVAYPDDDCEYYSDTLSMVYKLFDENNYDVILGRIFDRKNNISIIKKWPNKIALINSWNYYKYSSSITLFHKKEKLRFDADFGVGAIYGSNEDTDFIYRVIKNKSLVIYIPRVEVWHPQQNSGNLSISKVYNYGIGFGAMIRKNCSLQNFCLFVAVISFNLLKAMAAIFCLNWKAVYNRLIAVFSRVIGLFVYKI